MCGRYASARSVDEIASAFGISEVDGEMPAPDWNVAPTQDVAVCVVRDDRRVLTTARWGLVPAWAADPSIGNRLVNARLETLAEKPAFRDALAQRRCLLPADGWYEWQRRPDGTRQPHFLTRADGEICAFAGLWERWRDADGRPLLSVTIVTGPAPADLASLHDRAPLVMPAESWACWLDPGTGVGEAQSLLRPVEPRMIAAWPVGAEVGDVRSTGPALAAPVTVDEQPALF